MKNKVILSILLSALLVFGGCALAEGTRLAVQGTGVVTMDPDTATITLGVRETSKDVSEAQSAVNEKLSGVIDALLSMGIAEEDIHTDSINIYEDYDYSESYDGQPARRVYAASNDITVTIKDIENAGKYIDAVFTAGANTFSGISFSASDTEAAKKRALELSVQNARGKAEVLAAASGMTITGVTSVAEQGVDVYRNYYNGNSFDAAMEKAEETGAGTRVFSEQIQVSASVTVEYTMVPVE